MQQKDKNINEQIRADRVNVISSDWEKLWIMPLESALQIAQEREMDVVEIGKQDWIVLVKIIDYGKFLFKQQKNLAKNRVTSKKAESKGIKLSYRIEKHDLEIKKNQAIKFAQAGHPLKIMLALKWRENHYEAMAMEKMQGFIDSLSEFYKAEWRVMRAGNTFSILLNPKK